MEKSIYTYALIKALHSQGGDYIDSFCPFIVKVIGKNGKLGNLGLKENLLKVYHLDIPTYVLQQ